MNKFLDYESFKEKVTSLNDDYWNKSYNGRWTYIEPVIEELKLISPNTVLELGSYKISLMNFSDNMGLDIKYFDQDNIKNNNYIFDAKKTPWPIEDKKYDVFVALQVLEHLSPKQPQVFDEIKRISKKCILTVPYLWDSPNDFVHHNITDETINFWTNKETPYKKEVLDKLPNRKRVMLCYNFD
jgi:hypothetical protein